MDEGSEQPTKMIKRSPVGEADCSILKDFDFNLRPNGGEINRHFFTVQHKNEDFLRTYYQTTGESNDNFISPGTVLGCIGVSDAYVNIRPVKERVQPTTQEDIEALKAEIKKTHKVVEPGTVLKINDIYDNACAMWQRDLFFSLLEILAPESMDRILSYEDLSNLHTFVRNFPSWKCFQFSAAIGGGWWATREGFRSFVLSRDYIRDDENQNLNAKFVPRESIFICQQIAHAAQDKPPLLKGETDIIPEMFAEMVPSLKAPRPLKQYLLIISIVGNVKTLAALSATNLSQKGDQLNDVKIDKLINEIVSACPEKISAPVRTTLNGLNGNVGLFKFFQHLLSNPSKGGRRKTQKKRRTKRPKKSAKRRNKRTNKSKKRKL